jgi:hypothetical protein
MDRRQRLRDMGVPGSAYVAAVTLLAIAGFALDSALLLGIAALATLPISIAAVPAFYVVAGLLGLIPGATPDHATGSGYGTSVGQVTTVETGAPAEWYLISIAVIGVAALAVAALLNVLLLRNVTRARRHRQLGAGGTPVPPA